MNVKFYNEGSLGFDVGATFLSNLKYFENKPRQNTQNQGNSGPPKPRFLCHRTNRPMYCVPRLVMQVTLNHGRHLFIGIQAWTARTHIIHKAIVTIRLKPALPLAHGMFKNPKRRSDLLAGQSKGR